MDPYANTLVPNRKPHNRKHLRRLQTPLPNPTTKKIPNRYTVPPTTTFH